MQELKAALISAEVENPIDMERIKLALQGYNFGNGYISWAKTNYGGYSYANAVEFSTMQAQRLGWEKYGDTVPRPCVTLLSVWTGVHKRRQSSHCRSRFDATRQ